MTEAKIQHRRIFNLSSRAKPAHGTVFVGRTVGMLLSAQPNCNPCGGTGWRPDFQERCLRRCECSDPTEVVTSNK